MVNSLQPKTFGEDVSSGEYNALITGVQAITPASARAISMGTGPSTNPVAVTWPTVDVTHPPFLAAGDGTTDDSTAIQAAATAAAGTVLFFPKPASYYKILTPIAVSAGTTVILDPGVIIEQVTKYKPVFDCNLIDGITIEGNGALLRYTGSRTWSAGTPVRGTAEYTYGSGVWSSGSRTVVRNLRVEGLTNGVFFSAWNGTALASYVHSGNVAENILVDTVDFGLLFEGQSDFTFRGFRGKTVLAPSSTNPSHLIYGSFGGRNRQVAGADCEAWDIADSYAFQFKGIDGGTIKNLTARNCPGLLSLGGTAGANNTDLSFSNIAGRGMLTTGGNGQVFMQGGLDLRGRIDGLNLHLAASDRAILLNGVDCAMSNVTVRARHDTQADTHDVLVQGTRPTIDGISIMNIQDDGSNYATGWRAISISTSTDAVVRPLTILNTRIGIDVAAAATNPTVDLSGTKFTLAATSGLQRVFNASTTLRVVSGDLRVSADNGDAAKTLTVLADETTQQWNTPLTAARAVTLSTTGAYRGAKFRIVRTAAATGASALNVGVGPLKALTVGQWAEVEFDGTAWLLTAAGTL